MYLLTSIPEVSPQHHLVVVGITITASSGTPLVLRSMPLRETGSTMCMHAHFVWMCALIGVIVLVSYDGSVYGAGHLVPDR